MNRLISYLIYPIEKILRFWFPYAFRDDPINPEPQSKEARRKKRMADRRKRKDKQQQEGSATQQRRKSKKERENIQKNNEGKEAEADLFAKLENLKKQSVVGNQKKLGIEMVDMSGEMDKHQALDMLLNAEAGIGFYWHDISSHQVAIKFEKNSIKNEHKLRDNKARRQLKPLLYPIQNEDFDRTHVIPIGYHGSENDKRLLVGFNSKINQVDLKKFEDKVGVMNRKNTILWFVDIQKQKDKSAKWNAVVWNEKGESLLERTFHDKHEFAWLD